MTSRPTRAKAVVLADATSPEEAAAKLNVSARSIRRWRNDPELAELVRKTREETADDVKVAASMTWELIIERVRAGDIATKDLIVLGGITIDKLQLLTGGATARTEARDITGTISDVELASAIAEANAIATAPRGPDEAEEPAEG